MSTITIQGDKIVATSPEGKSATMPLAAFLEIMSGKPRSRGTLLPDGVKFVETRGNTEIWIHQFPPSPYCFKWIAKDSKEKFGKNTTYRKVTISLPYLITFAVFVRGIDGNYTLSGRNECFFLNHPIEWKSELSYPALLNISKFPVREGNPLAWICTQYINRSFDLEPDPNQRKQLAFRELLHCLLESGFNYSSEHNEGSSWYTESKGIDPRISTVEAWEAATSNDKQFALDIPWLPTGLTTEQITDRIFALHHTAPQKFENANDLSRVVFNHGKMDPPEPTLE